MGLRSGTAILLALLFSPAAAPRAAAAAGDATAAPVPPTTEDAAAVEAYGEVRAAFARGEYERALQAARPVLKGESRHESAAWVLYMACVAEGGLDHHLSCVEIADRYLLEMKDRGWAERGYTPPVALARARSLAALGREKEAETALEAWLRANAALTAARDADALLVAIRSSGACSVDLRYAGRVAADSKYCAGTRIIAEALPAAVERVRERLGSPQFDLPDVAVYFRDADGAAAEGPTSCSLHRVASRRVEAIRVSASALVERRPEFVEMLAAGVFRGCVLASDAEGRPDWLLRGLTAWASAPEAIDPLPALRALGKTPADAAARIERALSGVDSIGREEAAVQEAAGLLLVAELERTCVQGTVRRLARKVLDGADPWEAFSSTVGRTPGVVLGTLSERARLLLAPSAGGPGAAATSSK